MKSFIRNTKENSVNVNSHTLAPASKLQTTEYTETIEKNIPGEKFAAKIDVSIKTMLKKPTFTKQRSHTKHMMHLPKETQSSMPTSALNAISPLACNTKTFNSSIIFI